MNLLTSFKESKGNEMFEKSHFNLILCKHFYMINNT